MGDLRCLLIPTYLTLGKGCVCVCVYVTEVFCLSVFCLCCSRLLTMQTLMFVEAVYNLAGRATK